MIKKDEPLDPIKPLEEKEHTKEPEVKEIPDPKADCLKKIGEILLSYNNRESDIPFNHEYWNLVNVYRSM